MPLILKNFNKISHKRVFRSSYIFGLSLKFFFQKNETSSLLLILFSIKFGSKILKTKLKIQIKKKKPKNLNLSHKMISSIVIVNAKGEILIYRVYKDDITCVFYFFSILLLIFSFPSNLFLKFFSQSSRNSAILHKNRRNQRKQRITNSEH